MSRLRAVTALAVAGLAGGLWRLGVPEPEAEPRPVALLAPVPSLAATPPQPVAGPAPPQRPADAQPPAAAAQPASPAPMPYRFIGRVVVEGEQALVFFGRGRTVSLRGPGPLDEEYAVDAILDQQVLLRHVPTSSARFVDLAARQIAAAPAASPGDSPAD